MDPIDILKWAGTGFVVFVLTMAAAVVSYAVVTTILNRKK